MVFTKYDSLQTLELFEGMKLNILLKGSDTNGVLSIFEDIANPGVSVNRHIHHKQDETFLILEGTFAIEVNGQLYQVKAGDTAFVPMGSVHAWKNVGNDVGRLRYIFTPALNIDQMFLEVDHAIQKGELSPEFLEKIALKYPEQETVGPPL